MVIRFNCKKFFDRHLNRWVTEGLIGNPEVDEMMVGGSILAKWWRDWLSRIPIDLRSIKD